MMPPLYLNLEAIPGSDVRNACERGISLADWLGVIVKFDFNGVCVICRAGDNPARIVEAYHRALGASGPHRFASDSTKADTPASAAGEVRE